MKLKEVINNLFWAVIIVLILLACVNAMSEIADRTKVAKQDNCIELNGKYYCEVK